MPHSPLGPGAEFDLIRRFLHGGAQGHPGVRVGPGDDAAVVTGRDVVLTADLSVEGIHFEREWIPFFDAGWRAASGALSDLAAMAARPIGILASVAAAPGDREAAAEMMAGVRAAVEAIGGVLIGGDVTRSPGPLLVDVVAVGESSAPVLRSTARAGDELWVTGALGGAAAYVRSRLAGEEPVPGAVEAYARPVPRIAEALWLHERGVLRAMLDLSDGLTGDAGHIAAASGVAVLLEPARIPVHHAAAAAGDAETALTLAASGGEDYELCFAAPPGLVAPLVAGFEAATGTALSRVGAIAEGEGVHWLDPDGSRRRVDAGGYQHFTEDA